jgi:copper(I)-binding protein
MKNILAITLSLCLLTACVEKKDTMMVHEPQSFETAKGMKVGAALMVLHNTANNDDELIKVTSTSIPRVEMHNMIDDNGIMRMREVKSIPIKAGDHVALTPQGYHIMLMDLTKPLVAGETINLTLYFKNSKPITTNIPVESRSTLKELLDSGEVHDHH